MNTIDKSHLRIVLALITACIFLFSSSAGAGTETAELSTAVFYVH